MKQLWYGKFRHNSQVFCILGLLLPVAAHAQESSFEHVQESVGNPNKILSTELLSNGKKKTVARYESLRTRPNRNIGEYLASQTKKMGAHNAIEITKFFQREHPAYLVTFTDGTVTGIEEIANG